MENLILFLLSTAGLTIIVTYSYLFKEFRNYFEISKQRLSDIQFGQKPTFKEIVFGYVHKLVTCPLCFGFWAGAINCALLATDWGHYLMYCFAGSIVSLIIYDKALD